MKRIAVIPARGGSKRLPRKNVLPFDGKPMLIWSCEAARESKLFDRVIVSTDDKEIATVAEQYGFEVDIRPAELGSDTASVAEVCFELLNRLGSDNEVYDLLCVLYATAPLRTAEDIIRLVDLIENEGADSAHAMTTYAHHPHQMMIPDAEGNYIYAWPLVATKKSQELPEAAIGNGSTYAVSCNLFMQTKSFSAGKLKGYFMPKMRSIDIDTQEDLDIALCFSKLINEG